MVLSGSLRALETSAIDEIEALEFAYQPMPSQEECDRALEIVRRREPDLRASLPMPPLLPLDLEDGRTRRLIAVALQDRDLNTRRIVGVRPFHDEIVYDLGDLLPQFLGDHVCDPSPAEGNCASTGSQGEAWINVYQGGVRIWRFLVVRPAASSGTNGSGIELRYVDYRGHRVLYRAHVPILNIEYFAEGQAAGCGPTYRDWQNSENCFDAPVGHDVVPGIRICSSAARTITESGSDAGNFRGVAIYVDGLEVVLVSEMQAGWYRYISEWRFHANGTIRPRFGFAATANPCTCFGHHHHVYWRLDFDVDGVAPNTVEEFNDPPLFAGSNWHNKSYEIRRPADQSRRRRWRVRNSRTGAAYMVVPGATDGTATAFGVGDLWVLRYRGNELDDGQTFTTDPALSRARLDTFKTPPEPVTDTDVVIWYSAHFLHDETHGHPGGHYVGPELVPEQWLA